ncbi:MAG: carbon-nitrogen hydrolase family protein [Anaerolineales bacterium]
MQDKLLKIALIQMPVCGDKHANVDLACEKVTKAASAGADLIVLPEMFNCPYSNTWFRSFAEPQGGETWRAMSTCARENQVFLVAGSIPEREDERVYNTSFVFDPAGKQVARHRKMHLFDIDVDGGQRFFEAETFSPGSEVTVFETPIGMIGLCICFDMRFPELARLMALKGAQAIIVPGAFNMTTGPAHWEIMFRQRAVDNQLFTIGVAPARDEHAEYVSYGNSIVCSPWGDVLHRAGAEEVTLVAELDLSMNDRIRAQLPLLSALRDDVYSLSEK